MKGVYKFCIRRLIGKIVEGHNPYKRSVSRTVIFWLKHWTRYEVLREDLSMAIVRYLTLR
jgi:hypothetical protein